MSHSFIQSEGFQAASSSFKARHSSEGYSLFPLAYPQLRTVLPSLITCYPRLQMPIQRLKSRKSCASIQFWHLGFENDSLSCHLFSPEFTVQPSAREQRPVKICQQLPEHEVPTLWPTEYKFISSQKSDLVLKLSSLFSGSHNIAKSSPKFI